MAEGEGLVPMQVALLGRGLQVGAGWAIGCKRWVREGSSTEAVLCATYKPYGAAGLGLQSLAHTRPRHAGLYGRGI